METNSKLHFVSSPDVPRSSNRVILEYVFANHTNYQFWSKVRVVDTEPKTVQDCPIWDNYMWNSINQDDSEFFDMIMKPVAMFENPFLKSPHKLVLCDMWLTLDKPAGINTRVQCVETMERLKHDPLTGHRPTQPHDPWFGIEQEYVVMRDDGKPASYDNKTYDYSSLIIYCSIGHEHDRNVGIERDLSIKHLQACIYAGIYVSGCIRENGPSQWEYQVGPCLGVTVGDHLQMSRYILLRLAEMYGLRVTLKAAPVSGEAFFSGGHLNFSVRKMREKGGIKFINHAIEVLSKSDPLPLLQLYDQTLEKDNSERLANKSGHWHPRQDDFVVDGENKVFTTIRIPPLVAAEGRGYMEDRRPPSSVDPYAATSGLVRACVFGDFLKPGNEHLKDLSVWDKDASELN
ncbi:glutamine synthetase-like [Saccostrea cucullata]|uniref:glutamine synthetase-like n=1 Tax=Saccostrea cuccullata TaxID=36930 RepID=UPI002ED1E2EC